MLAVTWSVAIRKRLVAVIDIRPSERLKVVLLSLYFFLVITSYYVIKPVRNSLFIQRLGADNLPYVYIATAILVGFLITFYSRFADRITRRMLIQSTFLFLASNLVLFWWILGRGGILSSGAFYIWAKLYPLLLVSQFWLVANDFFTTPQAKRVFGVIGAGGIIGGIVGSSISGAFATLLGSERLLLVSAALLGLCSALLVVIDRLEVPVQAAPVRKERQGPPPGAWKLLKESAHLRTIAYILGFTIVVSTILDWQFAKAIELFVAGEDAKTAFIGRFFILLNTASVIIQFLLTSWILRVFGVGIALLLLPLGLLTGSIGIIIHPGLWTTAFAQGTAGALRYSLDQSTRELLFLPMAPDLKYRGKPLIDLVVYRGGTGVAGIIVLVGNKLLGFGLREMGFMAVAIVGLWLITTVAMRREYKTAVRRLISTRDVEARELLVQYLDAGTRTDLVQALESGDEKAIIYSLTLLDGIDDRQVIARADRLLDHPAERVRSATLRILNDAHARDLEAPGNYLDMVEELLDDSSIAVRSEAVRFICRYGSAADSETLQKFLEASEPEVRAAALASVVRHGNIGEQAVAGATLLEMANKRNGPVATRERKGAAEALGLIDEHPQTADTLSALIHDTEIGVQLAAMRAAARARRRDLVPDLAAHLCCAHARSAAGLALAACGPEVIDQLAIYLRSADVPLEVRMAIPSVFYETRHQSAVDTLVKLLPRLRPVIVRRSALKALNRMRRNYGGLSFDRDPLERALKIELRRSYQFAADRTLIDPEELIGYMLAEHERRGLERVTRILGLMYPQSDILAAYQGLLSSSEAVRAAGFELLDSTLSVGHRRVVGPLADPGLTVRERAERGATLFARVEFQRRDTILQRLARQKDEPWLSVVACAAGGLRIPELAVPVKPPFHLHPLPRAGVPYRAIFLRPDETMMLKLVERADFLRGVDIFSDVRAEDLAKIAAIAQEREYATGATLFSEGDPGSEMFLILSGEVEASRRGDRAFTVKRGDTVGTLTLIDERPRELTVRAVGKVRVLVIARDDFFDLMKDHFNLAEGMFVHLARLLRRQQGSPDPERT